MDLDPGEARVGSGGFGRSRVEAEVAKSNGEGCKWGE